MRNSMFLWLFWVCFIQILFSINNHLASSICLDDQRSLLLQLKRNLDYTHLDLSRLDSWNHTLDCCQWRGVQCNSSTGHVIGLDLSGQLKITSSDNLRSLFSLQFLQSLNLANNGFNGAEIPSGFGRLDGLTYLNLSNAGFSGQVPIEISQLVKLITLDLSSLSLLGGSQLKLENPSLAMVIRNLTDLRGLYLSGVAISANGSEWSKALSSSVPNLQFLSLSNCNLSGKIDKSLEKLQSLSEIHLDQNNLAAPVPEYIANFRNLTTLKLSSCKLQGTFPQNILKLLTLRSLDLSFNELLQGTLPEFPLKSSLQILVVSYTNFSGQLPNSISNLTLLQRIELVNCRFSGSISPAMERLNQLVYVDFSFNKFSGPIPAFSLATNLEYLSLNDNTLTGTLKSRDWAGLSKLLNLDLSINSLNGSIPMSLFSLPSLQILKLGQNKFSGQLRDLPNMSLILNTLNLSSNTLDGPIPKSLFDLKGLKVLDLSSNNFSGYLNLNEIQQLKNLSSLELSHNSLSVAAYRSVNGSSFPRLSSLGLGSCNLQVLPFFLKNQCELVYLDLSDNHIQGAIPKWIWRVGNKSLSSLNLSCNSFTGLERPLPDTPSLRFLDISSNKIRGEVPTLSPISSTFLDYSNNNFTSISPEIGNSLLYTQYLSLSRNNISQEIPVTLCNARNLLVLDLSSNDLRGTIPDCIIKMTLTLGVLNLRENHLSGNIVNIFPEGCRLSTIDIGSNFLQEQVPLSLVNCKQLEVLDFRRNQLQDTFPCWLRNLSNLQTLVLRDNKFHGSVVCPPSNIGWPKLQIVDIASNEFNGELKSECFSNMTALMARADNPQLNLSVSQYSVLKLSNIYYQNMVVVTSKGTEITLQKVLNLFKGIDFSNNSFQGDIPDSLGNLNALIVLNLSHNAFSGTIPSSIGNLSNLESLDLSHNNLNGSIPKQLVNLNFLGVMNLSFNNLAGKIPEGTQLQSFGAYSYTGNKELCGEPLPQCSNSTSTSSPSKKTSAQERKSSLESRLDWQYIVMGSGFGTGAALVIAPLMFWKKGRKWYDKRVAKFIAAILLACGINYASFDEESPQLEEGIEHQLFDITGYREDETEDEGDCGRFCVFCSKLDIERKRVIHSPSCTCNSTTSFSSSFSISSSQ